MEIVNTCSLYQKCWGNRADCRPKNGVLSDPFILWLVMSFIVAFSFHGILRIWKKLLKNTCYNFMALISFAMLQSGRLNRHVCYRSFCQTIDIEMLRWSENEKLHVKIVVLILQETILHGTRKEAQLEHCIVTSVPVPSLLPRLKGIIILLQGPVNQNLPLISSVNFVIKSFQDFTLYVNKKTPNMAFQLIHKCWSGWYHQRIWSRES